MARVQEKRHVVVYRGWKRVLYSYPALIVLVVIVLFLARSTFRVYLGWQRARTNRNEAQARYTEEVTRQSQLEANVAKLKTQAGWEDELRSDYTLAKPGEGVIIIVNDKATSTH